MAAGEVRDTVGTQHDSGSIRVGYLVPEFPGQTHVFFWREVTALREMGVGVEVISTRRPEAGSCRHEFAARAVAETSYVFPPGLRRCLKAAAGKPWVLAKAFRYVAALKESSLRQRIKLLALIPCAAELAAICREKRVNHLHVHSCADAGHLAALCKLIGGPRYSLTLHGDLAIYGTDHRSKMVHASAVTCVTRPLVEEVVEKTGIPRSKVVLNWMGVDTRRFVADGRRQPVPGRLHLVTVARLHINKGHVHALRAVRSAVNAGCDVRYTIAGSGPYEAEILSEVRKLGLSDRVTMRGTVGEDEVLALLRAADAFVLPSVLQGEAAPVAVMEAMSCGLPVISSIIGGTPDMITHGEDGILVAQRDEAGLAGAFVRLCNDVAERDRLGRAARETAVAMFDARVTARRLLTEVLTGRRGGTAAAAPREAGIGPGSASADRPRVLVIAETANPEWVSVPLVGWSHARALSAHADTHIVTHVRNRDAMVRAGLVEGTDFTAIDAEWASRMAWRLGAMLSGGKGKGWTTMTAVTSLAYYEFERRMWKEFRRRITAGKYDIVHRVTPLSPTMPSLIAGKCKRAGVPFVAGPLNGGLPWPKGFGTARRQEREWLSYLRSAYKLLPGYRGTRKHATALLIASRATLDQVPSEFRDKCVYVPENGIDPARFNMTRTRRAGRPVHLLFVGRLVPYKGADMLIEAAAPFVRKGLVEVEIVGDGPQRADLEAQVERLGLRPGVRLSGWVAHERVQETMCAADLFVLPSIREFGGGVVLEAMAVGLPPVVVNYGGPGELVTPETGFVVAVGPREQIVKGLADVFGRVVADPDEIETRGQEAIRRVHDLYTWDAKARQVMQVYDWVLHRRASKPQFSIPLTKQCVPADAQREAKQS